MSFTAQAIGSSARGGTFMFRTREFPDPGDVFDAAELIGNVASITNYGLGVAGSSRTVPVDTDVRTSYQFAVNSLATQALIGPLSEQLAFLAMSGTDARILLNCYSPGNFIGIGSFAEHRLIPVNDSQEPGELATSFMRAMIDCRVNNWGVMRAIIIILSDYQDFCDINGYHNPTLVNINIRV